MRVEFDRVGVDTAGTTLIDDVSIDVPAGTTLGLLGPNGSGKSTLLRAVYRGRRPSRGRVRVGGDDIWRITARDAARRTAVVLQDDHGEFEFSAREVVELGRIPHRRPGRPATAADRDAVDRAITLAGVERFAHRGVASLSGGERQRVALARALAQDAPVLVLDEPTNHLDILAQVELLELIATLPTTTLVALHDLGLASAHCDRVAVLRRGRLVTAGPPADVVTPRLIADVYGVEAVVGENPLTARAAVHIGRSLTSRSRTGSTHTKEEPTK